MLGRLWDLPTAYQTYDRSYDNVYDNSSVFSNPLGEAKYRGQLNSNIKRTITLEWRYLPTSDKDDLLNIFKRGKGGLPIWYFDDTSDTGFWIFGAMKTLTLTEPAAGAFNITIQLAEF